MTISNELSEVRYRSDGDTLLYTVPFYFLRDEDLLIQVIKQDYQIDTLILNRDYTVTGANNLNGGQVLLKKKYAYTDQINILRNLQFTQEVSYQENGPFPAKLHEQVIDKLTMMAQQAKDVFIRALSQPLSGMHYDAKNRNIQNLAEGVKDNDAVTLKQVRELIEKAHL